jgi:hypothetical protein
VQHSAPHTTQLGDESLESSLRIYIFFILSLTGCKGSDSALASMALSFPAASTWRIMSVTWCQLSVNDVVATSVIFKGGRGDTGAAGAAARSRMDST